MPAVGDRGDHALGWTKDLPDRYEIVREHGRGGMATVYLATDRKHDRPVALKVLAPELGAGIGAERFLREIQIAAHLNHPHIVPLLDSGVVDGRPFYVMPFVEGESLRERLEREGPLPVDQALRIARDVAEALAYAHNRDVVHRDIKPGNVLLAGESAVVADFGIAAALDSAPEDHLTRTGISVGSVGYMSPEQAGGDEDVDARTDQYSLACVLYEMLAGRTPFVGRNARETLSRQLTEDPLPISTLRADASDDLDLLIQRGLAREPSERFSTTKEFADALGQVAHQAATGLALRFRTRPAIWLALAVAVLIAASAWMLPVIQGVDSADSEALRADTSRYAVFPFDYLTSEEVQFHETTLLRTALKKWTDVDVVEGFQLEEAIAASELRTLTTAAASRVALAEGAGRFILGRIIQFADGSFGIVASLFAADPDEPESLASYEGRLSDATADPDSLFRESASYLLWQGNPPEGDERGGTRSLDARKSFEYGMDAVAEWDLSRADSGFTRAVTWDSEYAEAHLWRALVRSWTREDPAVWALSADQAALRSNQLDDRDASVAAALVNQARQDYGKACPQWRALATRFAEDFVPWYGLAICLDADDAVVRDDASPTGWVFRSSRHGLVEAYRQAFRILPSILEAFSPDSYASLRQRLQLTQHTLRTGYSIPDSTKFFAYAAWTGDSLAYWPRPTAFGQVDPREAQLRRDAVERQRRVFRDIAATWATDAPSSAAAREVLAIALAAEGNSAALDTLNAARALTTNPSAGFRMAALEVWLRIVFGLPHDHAQLERARTLADSLINVESTEDLRLVPGLAALTGRGYHAARVARETFSGSSKVPGPDVLASDQAALLMYSAMGGPADSIEYLARRLARRIASGGSIRSDAQRQRLYSWLALPASLSFSAHPLPGRERITDWLVSAQTAVERGDKAAARDSLGKYGTVIHNNHPYSRTLDALFAEAALWATIGDAQVAADWLDPTLTVLPQVPSQLLSPERCAALVRIAALRAELAADPERPEEAAAWARAVSILWSDADDYLQPLVSRMTRLATDPRT